MHTRRGLDTFSISTYTVLLIKTLKREVIVKVNNQISHFLIYNVAHSKKSILQSLTYVEESAKMLILFFTLFAVAFSGKVANTYFTHNIAFRLVCLIKHIKKYFL